MRFEFATATRIIFGPGTMREVPRRAAEMGQSAFVVSGHSAGRAAPLIDDLNHHGLEVTCYSVSAEPTIETALTAIEKARKAGAEVVVAIGGGSVMDTGKVVAALLTNSGELEDYLEVIGKGRPLVSDSAACIAVPTTAGTGAEVTRNSVLGSSKHGVKVSMRSPLMLPRLAVVDPELTYSMPPPITATTGLDAFTQLLEAFVSRRSTPMTDGICREGLRRASRALFRAFENGHDAHAREDMCLASLFGGLALANAKLGAVHGIAGPFGGMYPAAHGAICARLLPYVMETNIAALRMRAAKSPALERYTEVARILTQNMTATTADGIAWVHELCAKLHTPGLSQFGFRTEDFGVVVEKSQRASSMRGNPIELTDREIESILRKAM